VAKRPKKALMRELAETGHREKRFVPAMKGLCTASVLTEGAWALITAAGQRRTRRRANLLPTGPSAFPLGNEPLEPLPPLCGWLDLRALQGAAQLPAQHQHGCSRDPAAAHSKADGPPPGRTVSSEPQPVAPAAQAADALPGPREQSDHGRQGGAGRASSSSVGSRNSRAIPSPQVPKPVGTRWARGRVMCGPPSETTAHQRHTPTGRLHEALSAWPAGFPPAGAGRWR
jgi:hypothetical protein